MNTKDLSRWMLGMVMLAQLPWTLAAESTITDPVKLIRDVQAQSAPRDETVRITMKLIDRDGKVSQRTAWYSRKLRAPSGIESMKLIRFDSPAEMAGSGVLTMENVNRPDDQWLYLPAFHVSRKIPSSNRSDRYMGTDFFFEDVSEDKINAYQYTVQGHDNIDGHRLVKIEQVPLDETVKRESAYGKKILWVDPERLIVARIDFFDKSDAQIKRFIASDAARFANRWRWKTASMTDLRSNHRTEITYSERKIDTGLADSLFTVRNLERGQ